MSVVPPVTFHERVNCPISGRNDLMSLGYLIDEEECEGDDAEVSYQRYNEAEKLNLC